MSDEQLRRIFAEELDKLQCFATARLVEQGRATHIVAAALSAMRRAVEESKH